MKTRILNLVVILVLLTSCNSTKKENTEKETTKEITIDDHTSKTALDWQGVYKGTLPCADCSGIKTTIQLNEDLTYSAIHEYEGKKDGVFNSRGYFKWIENGQKIILSDADETSYFVGENTLTQLDASGNKVTGELAKFYILKKQVISKKEAIAFTNTKWKLTNLLGKDVSSKNAFITFSTEDNKVYGNGSCNNFNGAFTLKEGNRIVLSKIASTMMSCEDMSTETPFLSILEKVDNYSLNANKMTLNKAKMAPLAVFEAVE
ncbi:copper resistance protein NlpE N-terminal domain-containing protein [Lacinutrix himadriensis]|uniref:copper resistance protein NlpE N-terminal domain-containing protein n=1 Tax=Lacinutrix himadriensis TaxID=641549 RepID=UPI0006E30C90|nr:copper resistance protein NlpE N-terminal domain-containing protein [Lacinutrix himadriensis]